MTTSAEFPVYSHERDARPPIANSRLSLVLNDDGPGGPHGRDWLYRLRARVDGDQVELLEISLFSPLYPRDYVASVSERDLFRKCELNGITRREIEAKLIWRAAK